MKDKKEVNEKICNLFAVLLVLLFVTGAGAMPAVTSSSGLDLFAISHSTATQVQLGSDPFKSVEFSCPGLIEIGKEISEPPVAVANSTKSSQFGVRSLPAIPATFFMVLTGFLCVSLVRDRKIWRTAAFGVLYLGAAGINAVPQLLSSDENIKTKQAAPKGVISELRNFIRPQCDAQGTRYIGLLRRMAIPDGDSFAENHGRGSFTGHWHISDVLAVSFLRSVLSSLYSYISAIIKNYNPQPSPGNSSAVGRISCFCVLEEFTVIKHLAHGPPGFA